MKTIAVETLRSWLDEGRPDLAASPAEAQQRAAALYQSVQQLLALSAETVILPGHSVAPVPFDGVPLMDQLSNVEARIELLHASQADFVRTILRHLPATPANYQQIVALNEQGLQPDGPATELEAGANRCAIA